jgi:outer membrane protein OmpA-like peptidoglycan-associated protein
MRLFAVVLLFTSVHLSAQVSLLPSKNLVPNGSFENYRKKSTDIRRATPWRSIESVDYYQAPLKNDTTAERGAADGECYAGFRFRKKYKEFAQVRLVEPLKRGALYHFSMQVRLAFWSNACIRSFGVLFTKGGYRSQGDAIKSNMVDTVCEAGGLLNNYRWITISGTYKADGGEKFLTIGNFAPKIKKELVRIDITRFGAREAFYFVDNIQLERIHLKEEEVEVVIIGPIFQTQSIQDSVLVYKSEVLPGEKFTLPSIVFQSGRYYLLPESYPVLNQLAAYLIKHPDASLKINGHSDNAGLPYKNQKMSELRAREVFEYLIHKGVQNKMYFKGFGSLFPIADNTTEEGRIRNRRVEFEIIQN